MRRATAQPIAVGGCWPRAEASTGTSSTASENASPTATAGMRSRLVVQPRAPGHWVELRHANAFATWASTTVMKAAPDAARAMSPVGNGRPGLHPYAR